MLFVVEGTGDGLAGADDDGVDGAAVAAGGGGEGPVGRDVDLGDGVCAWCEEPTVVGSVGVRQEEVGAVAGVELEALRVAAGVGDLVDDDGTALDVLEGAGHRLTGVEADVAGGAAIAAAVGGLRGEAPA